MTEKATIFKLVVYISLQLFNVRPFIKKTNHKMKMKATEKSSFSEPKDSTTSNII